MAACSFLFFSKEIIEAAAPSFATAFFDKLYMPTNPDEFAKRPWTILTALFFDRELLPFLSNMFGLFVFGRLTALLFSQRAILPLFLAGGLTSFLSIWVFSLLPLTKAMLYNQVVQGSSGAVMSLVVLSTFYMPEQIVRMYGVYPLKLKFIGRAFLLFAVVAIFLKYDYLTHFLLLGGAFGGYLFIVMLRRYDYRKRTIALWEYRKKVHESASVEMNGNYQKPINDEQYNEIQVSKKEYLDHLLDKIGNYGIESLSESELHFLEKYGKE